MENSFKKEIWNNQSSSLYERLYKTLHYDQSLAVTKKSKDTSMECISLPLTEVAVDLIEKTIISNKRRLGKLDVNYASFILDQACLSPTSVILAMIYLDRIKKINSEYLLKITSSELFLASLIVASKFLFDKGGDEMVYNDEWASFANLDLSDLNKLERDFLEALKWSCFVDPETFMKQVVKFEGLISVNEYLKRKNSMTYIEMISFFKYLKYFHKDHELVWMNISNIFKSILICTAAYFIAIGIVLISSSLVFTLQNHIYLKHDEPIKNWSQTIHNFSIPKEFTFSKDYLKLPQDIQSYQKNYETLQYQSLFFKQKHIKC